MVNILDLLAEQKSRSKYLNNMDKAMDYFAKQKSQLEAISNTSGFKEIVRYWSEVLVACQERLETVKSDDIKGVQAEMRLSKNFFNYLNGLLNADLTQSDEDI